MSLLDQVKEGYYGGDYRGRTFSCNKGLIYEFRDYRDKELQTVLGKVKVKRAYYYDSDCKRGYCPKDKGLDIERTFLSPGVRRMIGRVGAYRPFALGHDDIKEMAGIDVNTKEVERVSNKIGKSVEEFYKQDMANQALIDNIIPIKSAPKMYICMDGTGVPVIKKETANRRGKGKNGEAKTRESKLGCVFTQTAVDEKGYPVRDESSTSYVGAIETADEFAPRIYAEAVRRGVDSAEKVCVIGDGAAWIWNIADEQFYGATQIVDLYHAREHYWKVGKIFFLDKNKLKQWAEKRRKELNKGNVEQVIEAIKKLSPSTEQDKDTIEREIGYFEKNKERMRYKKFRRQGLFVGSGVLEAGCKTVIGQRLKQSGMHWTVKGANNIIALRSCFLSNRWEDFWEYRSCA